MLIDSHAHLDFVEDLEGALARAKEAGVGKIITIGTSIGSSKKAIEIAQKFSDNDLRIFATCGLHPKDAKSELEKFSLLQCINTLKQIALSSNKVVAIGEIGLDYYSPGEKRIETVDKDKIFQRKLFEAQIKLATDLKLPLVIHCRNGWKEIFDLLSNVSGQLSSIRRAQDDPEFTEGSNVTGVFHSWTGDWEAAQKALDLGFYISFSGIVTFGNAKDVQEVAKKTPLDRIILETDSPFLAPEPLRSGPPKLTSRLSTPPFHEKRRGRLEEHNRRVYKQNEPKNVRIVAQFLAHLRNQPINTIIGASADNAKRLFGI